MINKYRLTSTIYDRENDEDKIEPLKVYFLSVEGNATEKEYFEGVSAYRDILGINMKVDVEVLKRSSKDTNSAPKQVIELLEEYLELRDSDGKSLFNEIPSEFIEKYGIEFIKKYFEKSSDISRKRRNEFLTDLMKIGYDIKYREYLKKYDCELDEFGILIDRDTMTHSEANMLECIKYCKEKDYSCYIANPCFEFWLLLHLSDVENEYAEKLQNIKENKKINNNHTFVSKEVSVKAHHGKNGINFKEKYLPFVNVAIERAKKFVSDEEELVYEIGCNVWKLLEDMRRFCE